MNERITTWLKRHLVKDHYTEFGWQECHRYELDEDEMKELVGMIVRECADISDASFHNGSAGYTAILKHFGVKE